MRLKNLEIFGFKSFANKTVFSFPANFTAIVGPNGSGKSNIVDAIRWVLGERDLRRLRVSRSEELIFSGSPTRPRMSITQVSLTLDNSDELIPLDFKEIVVTRKLNRAGETEYLINGSPVRLKDIIELLAKAKIGNQGLTIINQGLSDVILQASPKERRLMIEENLGLREFQFKKEEAKRKLLATEENLEKARALLEELKPHLRSLRRQIHKWEKREEILSKLEELERIFFGAKFQELYQKKEKNKELIKELDERINQAEKILKDYEQKFEILEKKRPDFSQEFKKVREEIAQLEEKKGKIFHQLGQLEGRIESLRKFPSVSQVPLDSQELLNQITWISKQLNEIVELNQLEEIKKKIKEILKRIEEFLSSQKKVDEKEEELEKWGKLKDHLINQIKEIEEKIKSLNYQLDELRKKDEAVGSDSHQFLLEIQKQRNVLNQLFQERNQLFLEEEKIKLHENDLLTKLKEEGKSSELFSWEKIKTVNFEEELAKAGFEGNLADLEIKILRLRRELSSIGEVDELILKEAKETEERYQFLSREIEDAEKTKENLIKIIEELTEKIDREFGNSLKIINEEFNKFFRLIFGGGRAKLNLVKIPKRIRKEENNQEEKEGEANLLEKEEKEEFDIGIEFNIDLPQKKIKTLEMLSGGERTLVSLSALFAIIAAMKPPFVVLDEVDAMLDEVNAQKFAKILKESGNQTQFVIITHNRATMEMAEILYGISLTEEGVSKAVSLKLEEIS